MYKGFPNPHPGTALAGGAAIGLNHMDDALPLPLAILHRTALDHNAAWMAAFAQRLGLSLAPHGKTTMSPALFALQLRHGAWAITAATAHHARLYAEWGIRRIIIANQIVGRANFAILAGILARTPAIELFCLCDSEAGVAALDRELTAAGVTNRPGVLVEIGDTGHRAGVRSADAAMAVARCCHAAQSLRLAGVECFEGVHATGEAAEAMLAQFAHAARGILASGLIETDEAIVSAGGSLFFDQAARAMIGVAADRPARSVLRSGCYLTHDHGMYADALARLNPNAMPDGTLQPALEVWAHVQSRPEPTRVIASLGKRDVGHDVHLPRPILQARPGRDRVPQPLADARVAKLYDQHACLDVAAHCDLAVGDLIGFGISHPCTTLDKWSAIALIDPDYAIVDVIRTHFA